MSTNRNTKGQFARKTAPKKPVKKPTKAQREMERREALLTEYFRSISEHTTAILKQGERLDQIQRDIEQVRTLAHQTRTNSRANTVILNKTLAGVDLLKSGSSFMQEIEQHKSQPNITVWDAGQPEGPKAEPWVPKVNDWVVLPPDPKYPDAPTSPGRVSRFVTPNIIVCDGWPAPLFEMTGWNIRDLRPATPEEISEAEGEGKRKKLVRGCRVDTPDGEGVYLGRDGSECGREHIVSPDNSDSFWISRYDLDQLTPLT